MINSGYFIVDTECGAIGCRFSEGMIVEISFVDYGLTDIGTPTNSVLGEIEMPRQFTLERLVNGDSILRSLVNFGDSTPFQKKVWQMVMTVRPGETISYGRLASLIGCPGGARAVARALASNRIAVLVPCHRVVNSDGSYGGYKWGVNRKKALLEYEKTTVHRQHYRD